MVWILFIIESLILQNSIISLSEYADCANQNQGASRWNQAKESRRSVKKTTSHRMNSQRSVALPGRRYQTGRIEEEAPVVWSKA